MCINTIVLYTIYTIRYAHEHAHSYSMPVDLRYDPVSRHAGLLRDEPTCQVDQGHGSLVKSARLTGSVHRLPYGYDDGGTA